MNKLKTAISAVLLACAPAFSTGTPPSNIPITGQWDTQLPGHFMADTPLDYGEFYTVKNNQTTTVYVWLLEDRTPLQYFPLLPGQTVEFQSPGDSFDIYSLTATKWVVLSQESEDEDN